MPSSRARVKLSLMVHERASRLNRTGLVSVRAAQLNHNAARVDAPRTEALVGMRGVGGGSIGGGTRRVRLGEKEIEGVHSVAFAASTESRPPPAATRYAVSRFPRSACLSSVYGTVAKGGVISPSPVRASERQKRHTYATVDSATPAV